MLCVECVEDREDGEEAPSSELLPAANNPLSFFLPVALRSSTPWDTAELIGGGGDGEGDIFAAWEATACAAASSAAFCAASSSSASAAALAAASAAAAASAVAACAAA